MTPAHAHGSAVPPAGVPGPPRLAEGTELLGRMTGSGYQDAPTLVRRADGQTVQLTPLLGQLLELVDGRRDHRDLAAALTERVGKAVTEEDVRLLLDHKIVPLGLLDDPRGDAPTPVTSNPLLALRMKFVISNPRLTRRITAPFAWLFRPFVAVPVLLAFVAVCWWVLADKGLASATRSAFYDPPLLLAVLGLTVLSAGWHEFGHAAACRYGGATPGAMGAGLYIVWPAFYTDVNDAYRLSRWGRLRVDLGGLYFNAVIAVGIAAWWWASREDALLLGVAAQLLQMLRQLAPYIRADGYHILADLTGVPDLFAHMKPTLLSMLPWRWGRPTESTPLRRWARLVVVGWVLLVVPMLLALFAAGILLLPRLAATAWDSGQIQWDRLAAATSDGAVLDAAARVVSIVALVLPLAAVTYLLLRVLRRLPATAWRSTEGRPLARTAAVLTGAVLMSGVAWAWWPDGQYRPVHASERGTIGSLITSPGAVRSGPGKTLSPGREIDARPVSAMALVPRDAGADLPVVLLAQGEDGTLRTILTAGDGSAPAAGQELPFALPDEPGELDNQSLAVNTADGTVEYDVAVALVWVTDGAPALSTNEAYALASCTRCATVAVAFQVVLVVGQTDIVAPTNAAVAANRDCVACVTAALAVQLVVTLEEMPDEQVRSRLDAAMARLDGLDELTATLDVEAVYAQVKAVEAEILDILVSNGLVEDVEAITASASASASPSASAGDSAGASASTTASAGSTPSPEPSSSGSSAADSSTSPSASPSASPEASPSSEPTPSGSPTP